MHPESLKLFLPTGAHAFIPPDVASELNQMKNANTRVAQNQAAKTSTKSKVAAAKKAATQAPMFDASAMGGIPQLGDLMAGLEDYQNKKTCQACVKEGKEWCPSWDLCDVDDCEEDDIITVESDCTVNEWNEKTRKPLAPGVLVEIELPGNTESEQNALEDELFIEGKMRRLSNFITDEAIDPEFSETSNVENINTRKNHLVGTIHRAYYALDMFTVVDDDGFEIKVREVPEDPVEKANNTIFL